MTRPVIFLVGVVLAGAALFLAVGRPSPAERNHGDSAGRKSGSAPPKLPRSSLQIRSPEEAREHLRGFLATTSPSRYRFHDIATMVRKLDDEQLEDLAEDVGFNRVEGAAGWVRAALFEEWARRDFVAAMGFLAGAGGYDGALQQALYGAFRGSRPDDPRTAFHHLGMMYADFGPSTGPFSTQWSKHALREIFRDLARQDPAAAWALLNARDHSPADASAFTALAAAFRAPAGRDVPRDTALQGFFMGLSDQQSVLAYAREFETRWNSSEVVAQIDLFYTESTLSSFTSPPPEESIATGIAVALAHFDLDTAEHWAIAKGPASARSGNSRAGAMWHEWGRDNPDAALRLMQSGKYANWHETIASAVLRGDSHLAPDLIRQFHGEPWAARALDGSFPLNGSMKDRDYFPASFPDSHVPDYRERYEVLSESIALGKFEPNMTARLRESLDRSFQSIVPAAKAASEEP